MPLPLLLPRTGTTKCHPLLPREEALLLPLRRCSSPLRLLPPARPGSSSPAPAAPPQSTPPASASRRRRGPLTGFARPASRSGELPEGALPRLLLRARGPRGPLEAAEEALAARACRSPRSLCPRPRRRCRSRQRASWRIKASLPPTLALLRSPFPRLMQQSTGSTWTPPPRPLEGDPPPQRPAGTSATRAGTGGSFATASPARSPTARASRTGRREGTCCSAGRCASRPRGRIW